jgi:hypothetical protein
MMSIWWNNQPNLYGTKMYQFQQRLKYTKTCIKKWNKEVFGNIQEERRKLEGRMEELQQQIIHHGLSPLLRLEETQLQQEIMERDIQEEILIRQKSRVQWLQEGDKNTKFFHNSLLWHKSQNRIETLQKNDGTVAENHDEIESELVNYYRTLLTEPKGTRQEEIHQIIEVIPTLISVEQNNSLTHQISMEEVEEVVREMPLGKSPRTRWVYVRFFQNLLEHHR